MNETETAKHETRVRELEQARKRFEQEIKLLQERYDNLEELYEGTIAALKMNCHVISEILERINILWSDHEGIILELQDN